MPVTALIDRQRSEKVHITCSIEMFQLTRPFYISTNRKRKTDVSLISRNLIERCRFIYETICEKLEKTEYVSLCKHMLNNGEWMLGSTRFRRNIQSHFLSFHALGVVRCLWCIFTIFGWFKVNTYYFIVD